MCPLHRDAVRCEKKTGDLVAESYPPLAAEAGASAANTAGDALDRHISLHHRAGHHLESRARRAATAFAKSSSGRVDPVPPSAPHKFAAPMRPVVFVQS